MYAKYLIIFLFIATNYSFSQTVLRGSISGTVSLTKSNNPVLISSDLSIERSGVLLIGPGVEIIPEASVNISVRGRIIASGNASEPILFGSDGEKWGGLQLLSRDRSDFKYVEFFNGGGSKTQNSLIIINDGNHIFEYCKFYANNSHLIYIQRDGVPDLGSANTDGFNRFYPSQGRMAIFNKSKSLIYAQNNCWKISQNDKIEDYVYDFDDNDNFGNVDLANPLDCNYDPAKISSLIQPIDKSELFNEEYEFKWTQVKDVVSYVLEISTDTLFSDINYYQTPDTSYTINLVNTGDYFWRVVSVFEDAEQFYTKYNKYNVSRKIFPLNLITKDTVVNNSCEVKISWEEIEDVEYQLEITLDGSGEKIIIDSIKTNSFLIDYGELIKWRVRAVAPDAVSLWSQYGFIDYNFSLGEGFNYSTGIEKIIQYGDQDIIINKQDLLLVLDDQIVDSLNFESNIINLKRINKENESFVVITENKSYELINIGDEFIRTEINSNIIDYLDLDILDDYGLETLILKQDSLLEINNNNQLIRYINLDDNYKNIIPADIENDGKSEIIVFNERKLSLIKFGDKVEIQNVFEGEINSLMFFVNNGLMNYIFKSQGNLILMSFRDSLLKTDIPLTELGDFSFGIGEYDQDIFTDVFWLSGGDNEVHFGDVREREILLNEIEQVDIEIPISIQRKQDKLRFIKIDDFLSVAIEKKNCKSQIELKPYDLKAEFIGTSMKFEWKKGQNNYQSQLKIVNKSNLQEELFLVYSNKLIIDSIPTGEYYYQVRELKFDGVYSEWSQSFDFQTADMAPEPPKTWDYSTLTGGNSLIVIEQASTFQLPDRNLKNGDALGVFYKDGSELKCGGYSIIRTGVDNVITAWLDNSNTENIKDGFDRNEKYTFKVWDSEKEIELICKAHFISGPEVFKEDTISYIGAISYPEDEKIYLNEGWNYISFPLEIIDNDISKIITDPRDVAYNENFQSFRFGSINNTLDGYSENHGIQLYSHDIDSIQIFGWKINDLSIDLIQNEWVFVPYINNQSTSINEFFSQLSNEIIVKDELGNLYFPNKNINQIFNLSYGHSYKLFSDQDISFHYPEIQEIVEPDDNLLLNSSIECDTLVKGSSMHIIFQFEAGSNPAELILKDENGELVNCISNPVNNDALKIWEKNTDVSIPINSWESDFFIEDENGNLFSYLILDKRFTTIQNQLRFERDAIVEIEIQNNTSIYNAENIGILDQNNRIFIESDLKIEKVRIIDILGSEIYSKKVDSKSTYVNKNEVLENNGAYFLMIEVKGDNRVYPFSYVK